MATGPAGFGCLVLDRPCPADARPLWTGVLSHRSPVTEHIEEKLRKLGGKIRRVTPQ